MLTPMRHKTRSGEKRRVPWTGMPIFYEQRPGYGARDEVKHIDTPMGPIPMKATSDDLVNLKEIFMTWGSEASMGVPDTYALRMKNNVKELDPRAFNDEEKQAFDEADAAE